VETADVLSMNRSTKKTKQPKGRGTQSKKAQVVIWNPPGTTAQMRRGDLPGRMNQLSAAPAAQSRIRVNPRKPTSSMSPNGNRVIRFEEYVQDILTSGTTLAFTAQRFQVQPGISALFAWLADQAINYQEYRFRSLAFRFETDQSTGVAGKVMFAFSPDAADPVPVNKQEMLEYGVKGKSAIWQEFRMPCPVNDALGSRRYIRSGTLAANLDIKTYDVGALFVASSGVVATSANIGELYIEYEIELMTPVVQSLAAAQARGVRITAATAITEAAPYGTAPTYLGGLDVVAATDGTTLTFNRVGNYLITMEVGGTGLFTTYSPTATITNGTVTFIQGISNVAGNAGTYAILMWVVVVSARGAVFDPNLEPVSTTVTASVTRIATYSEV
jgi:hypothetical protein